MTKDVLVSISGLQMAVNDMESGDNEPIEIISAGTYFFKDGKHFVFFEEVAEGIQEVTKTQIRLSGKESLEVSKKGAFNMHMIFEKNKNSRCYYKTSYGQLNLGICTGGIEVNESENEIDIRVKYALDVNYEALADCTIQIHIEPRVCQEK